MCVLVMTEIERDRAAAIQAQPKREVTRAEIYRARAYFHPDKHANVLIVKLH